MINQKQNCNSSLTYLCFISLHPQATFNEVNLACHRSEGSTSSHLLEVEPNHKAPGNDDCHWNSGNQGAG